MHRQPVDSWGFCMHGKFIYVPAGLNGRNVTCIKVFLDFISLLVSRHLHGGSVMTLVDVLVNVFHSLNRSTDLYIDVAVELGRKIRIVGDNITVVISLSPLHKAAVIIRPGILGIAIITKMSGITKFLGKPF